MNIQVILLLLLFIAQGFQEDGYLPEGHYKNTIKEFYKTLHKDSVSIQEFSSVYGRFSMRDEYQLYNEKYRRSEIDKYSYSLCFEAMKQHQDDITFGLALNEVEIIIDEAMLSTEVDKFSVLAELCFPNGKKVYFELKSMFG